MRNIIAYFIKYPVAVNVLIFAIVLFGYRGLTSTKSSLFPLSESNIITISIVYPGASPAEIEEGVVLKIEDNLRGLIGIDRVTSKSQENAASITIETLREFDVDLVLRDVKNAVDRVPSFPIDMEPPVIGKNESLNRAIDFTISAKNIDLYNLKQIAREIEDDIRAIKGISQVDISGFPQEEIEIAIREQDLRAFDLTFQEVAAAVSASNILTTGGNIKTDQEEYLIRANNRSYYGEELDFVVIRAAANGQVIRLRDVADVRDRFAESPDALAFNGERAIRIAVSTTNNEDLVAASTEVVEYIDAYNESHENITLNIGQDSAESVRDRTALLVKNGWQGILLVLILLSLFLRPSIAFWVAFGLPVSFAGLFIFSPAFMTINVISLFGMIIVIGILVDDGIVIGENIYYHYEKGKTPIQAAIDGTVEVIPPIVSAILTTIVAFSTFLFIPERLGDFFGEIAVVVIIILGISLVEALIILPAHIAHSNALKEGKGNFILNDWAAKFMNLLRDKLYAPSLRFFLQNKFFALAVPIALMIITVGGFQGGLIRFTFFPSIASSQLNISLTMPQGTNESITDSIINVIADQTPIINEKFKDRLPDDTLMIKNIITRVGPGSANASMTINLLSNEYTGINANEVANVLREHVGEIYGVENIEYGAGSTFGGKPISISLVGNNLVELKAAKNEIRSTLNNLPQLKDVVDNDPAGIKEIEIKLKENAYLLGLTLNSVMSQVRSGFFGRAVQRFQRGRDEIRVWVRYDEKDRSSIKNLDDMWIVTNSRERVPLSEIAEYSIKRGDVAINHLDGQREIKVEASLKNQKDSAPEILASLQENEMANILQKYPTVKALYEGQNRSFARLGEAFQRVLPAIFFLIYAIIAFTFRSYSQPLLLFILIPFSMVGVSWGHSFHDIPVNILSLLGIIALIGILVNDGLVLIRKFNNLLKDGLSFDEAIYEAGKMRFRAIFLTSLTTVAGLAPLIFFEKSLSAQFLIPMAISIAYGIAFATFLTLFMLPTLLSLTNDIKVYAQWLWSGKKPSKREVERAIKEIASEKETLIDLKSK